MDEPEKTKLEIEREQLNLLIQNGVKFPVTTKIRRRKKGLKGFFQKRDVIVETTEYEIHEPTLCVLDRLCEVWLDMGIDEEALKEGSVIVEAKQLTKKNTKKMARIVAIAVLGEDYHIAEVTRNGTVKMYDDNKELNRLTSVFFHSIKPSKLASLSAMITSISNLADFITSMRLMSGARTTKPISGRIE